MPILIPDCNSFCAIPFTLLPSFDSITMVVGFPDVVKDLRIPRSRGDERHLRESVTRRTRSEDSIGSSRIPGASSS